jgi:hypothetical protein
MSGSFDLEAEIRDLAARRDIHKAVCNYMRGQDRLQPAIQRKAFHDDALVDCGLFAGAPDAYVEFAQGFLAKLESSQHLIGQVDIEVDRDVAYGEVYFLAWHRVSEGGEPKDLIVCGRYVDEYARRDGEWRIAKRREIIDWARTDPAADGFIREFKQLHLAGRHGKDFSETRAWPGE